MSHAPTAIIDLPKPETAADPRRAQPRFPLNAPFLVVPLDRSGKPLRSEAFDAVGIDISAGGLAISHSVPMKYCRALVSATGTMLGRFSVEVEVAWTKATSLRMHETGLKLVRKLS